MWKARKESNSDGVHEEGFIVGGNSNGDEVINWSAPGPKTDLSNPKSTNATIDQTDAIEKTVNDGYDVKIAVHVHPGGEVFENGKLTNFSTLPSNTGKGNDMETAGKIEKENSEVTNIVLSGRTKNATFYNSKSRTLGSVKLKILEKIAKTPNKCNDECK